VSREAQHPPLAVGLDLIEIRRIEEVVQRRGRRFLERVFTIREIEQCEGEPHRLAARWAAKEATAKALGTGVGDLAWGEVEVLCDARGAPVLHLRGAALQLARARGLDVWSVSLSHSGSQAAAVVVGLRAA
jgi:holo-[acyl-carrier protein] synthase